MNINYKKMNQSDVSTLSNAANDPDTLKLKSFQAALKRGETVKNVFERYASYKRWSYFVGQVSGEVKLQIVGLCYAAKAVFCPCFCSFGCRA
jgi:hypothetical protein